MISYHKLAKNRNLFFRFTGVSIQKFNEIYKKAEVEYPKIEEKRLSAKERKNAIGQGHKFKHDLKTRILMMLIYYRLYIIMDLMNFLFDLDKSNISRDIAMIEVVISSIIPVPKKMYKNRKKIKSIEELEYLFPDLLAIVDATEQRINRPKHKKRRDNHYSGKKKIYSRKTQIIVNKKGLILHKPPSSNGKKHDKKLFDEEFPDIPKEVMIVGDSGYQGIADSVENIVCLPRKKIRGKERTKEDKVYNRKLSKSRIKVENVIRKMKEFGIMGKQYRNKFEDYDNKIEIVTGLVNLRTMEREEWAGRSLVGV